MLEAQLPTDLADGAILREMTLHDIEAVHTAELALFPADAWPVEMFLAELTHPSRAYVVLELDGKIIGYAGAMSVADTADIQTIAVLPEYEGRGFGRAMLDFLHREVAARQAERVLLEVRADNPRAQDLYRRSGYEHIHTRPHYYRDGVDALIMQKRLKGTEND
ncbi:ribosomal protein S18-alanine N-acetyltransferase [Rothia aerolata]|uniref:Ribosomal-protein-alanine acetyltransferase n=1 Tax=Rothia aerolata TaxID=1812262 RepID=A0A917IRC6_9MICC|nr:ribosomal protein S18-alanine N-acetyltransferase [Rothia aerolata]GGH60304.1 ribosomal-protein-alanine acetyltransferase [Rothia aerolata]